MKAAVLRAFGGPDGLVIEELPEPVPSETEVLVRVRAVSVNRTDVHVMNRANIGRGTQLPHIGGVDPAGQVVRVGASVRELRPGQRVVARPMIPCLECRFCFTGRESVCEAPSYVGVHRPGGFAEFVALPARDLYPIPENLSFEEASASAHSVPIALHLLQTVGRLDSRDIALVVGAAGGLGAIIVQVASLLGSRVIAAGSNVHKLEPLRELGADHLVAYGDGGGLADDVRRLAGGTGASVAVDNIGSAELWPQVVASVDKGGRILSCGSHAGGIVTLDLNLFYRQQLRLISTAGTSHEEFLEAIQLVADGRVRPLIHRVVELHDIRAAFEEMIARRNVGKIVVRLS